MLASTLEWMGQKGCSFCQDLLLCLDHRPLEPAAQCKVVFIPVQSNSVGCDRQAVGMSFVRTATTVMHVFTPSRFGTKRKKE